MAAERSAPELFAHLQREGLAAPSPGDAAAAAVHKVFKLAGEQEAKKATSVASYSEFVEFMRKAKVLTREAHESDPESYWQMRWHKESVEHLYTEWGWDTASIYHREVMTSWSEGFLDLPSMVDTEECRRGNVAGALHQRFFMCALQATGVKPKRKQAQHAQATGNLLFCTFCKKKGNHVVKDCRSKDRADAAKKPC